jgi:hypothetical protein
VKIRWHFFKHDLKRWYEKRLTDIVWKLPKQIIYWSVVRAAVTATDSYPGDAKAIDMMKAME